VNRIEATDANRRARESIQAAVTQAALVGEKDTKQPSRQTGGPSGWEGRYRD
jgi:hypothetical protein